MTGLSRALILVLALALALPLSGAPAEAQNPLACKSKEADEDAPIVGKITCSYFMYQETDDWLKRIRLFEGLKYLLSPLRLPHALDLAAQPCGIVNAFYNPGKRKITICYELITQMIRPLAPEPGKRTAHGLTREQVIEGAVVAVLLHEAGHALFDMLSVPVFGREEDAADQIAIYIALNYTQTRELARTIVGGFAHVWKRQADMAPPKEWATFADEHGTAGQRYYNALCLAYGFDREAFKDFAERKVEEGGLPPERAKNCASEYQQLQSAYKRTIGPFINQAQFSEVLARDWSSARGR